MFWRVLGETYAANMSADEADASNGLLTDNADLHHEALSECDNSHSIVVKFEEVSAAAFKIRGAVERTPCNVSSL